MSIDHCFFFFSTLIWQIVRTGKRIVQSPTEFDDAVDKIHLAVTIYADVMGDLGLKLHITILKHIDSLRALVQNVSTRMEIRLDAIEPNIQSITGIFRYFELLLRP